MHSYKILFLNTENKKYDEGHQAESSTTESSIAVYGLNPLQFWPDPLLCI